MSENLKCKYCTSEIFHLSQKGQHIKSICAECGKYCRFISQITDEEIETSEKESPGDYTSQFGLHAGKQVKDMPLDYVKYCAHKSRGILQRKCLAFLEEGVK